MRTTITATEARQLVSFVAAAQATIDESKIQALLPQVLELFSIYDHVIRACCMLEYSCSLMLVPEQWDSFLSNGYQVTNLGRNWYRVSWEEINGD